MDTPGSSESYNCSSTFSPALDIIIFHIKPSGGCEMLSHGFHLHFLHY